MAAVAVARAALQQRRPSLRVLATAFVRSVLMALARRQRRTNDVPLPHSTGHDRVPSCVEAALNSAPRRHCSAAEQLFRKQQVRSSNLRVGSSSLSRSESLVQPANLVSVACHNAKDLLTERFPGRHTRGAGAPEASQYAATDSCSAPGSPAVLDAAGARERGTSERDPRSPATFIRPRVPV